MSHELYVQVLSAMFWFWNGARVLTYLPTIGKLLAKGADVRSHSLLSWSSWVLSNGTFALMLLEMTQGTPNQMFWMNVANTLMCLVVSLIIIHKRFCQPFMRTRLAATRERNPRKQAGFDEAAWVKSEGVGLGLGVTPSGVARFVPADRQTRWMALAGACVIGLVSTLTYVLGANRIPPASADALERAQPSLLAAGSMSSALPGAVAEPDAPRSPEREDVTPAAGPRLSPAAAFALSEHRAAPPSNHAQRAGAPRRGRAREIAQHRRHSPPGAKPGGSLLAWLGSIFHDSGNRAHAAASRRTDYSHP